MNCAAREVSQQRKLDETLTFSITLYSGIGNFFHTSIKMKNFFFLNIASMLWNKYSYYNYASQNYLRIYKYLYN